MEPVLEVGLWNLSWSINLLFRGFAFRHGLHRGIFKGFEIIRSLLSEVLLEKWRQDVVKICGLSIRESTFLQYLVSFANGILIGTAPEWSSSSSSSQTLFGLINLRPRTSPPYLTTYTLAIKVFGFLWIGFFRLRRRLCRNLFFAFFLRRWLCRNLFFAFFWLSHSKSHRMCFLC